MCFILLYQLQKLRWFGVTWSVCIMEFMVKEIRTLRRLCHVFYRLRVYDYWAIQV